ncbi:MAG: HTH domain-containing protein [Crocinitomicaceae bacterium]|nr:HTH domain-containing protein [Crocinitomicaceae bacterium]
MNIEKIKYFIHLIEKERTGTPSEVAQKLNVTERTIYYYLQILKNDLNAPIEFNKHRKTYQFERMGKLNWEWRKAEPTT